jgi:glycosyltransferase involved in cell wall biosynthesis
MRSRQAKEIIQDHDLNECCHIGVDLTLMIPAGGNGGIKPAILTFLQALEERFRKAVRFTLLTNSSTWQEVKFLVRSEDQLICIARTHGYPLPSFDSERRNFGNCPKFRPSMLNKLGIDVFYCPFGPTNRSTPGIPTVSMVTDLLHRDYPFSIPESERIWREEYFRDILSDACYIQCISQYTVDRLLEYYRIKRDRVFFTYLPIDQRLQCSSSDAPERPYFIYPANFWVHKNHEVLLVAYRTYRETTKDPWDLVLTGSLDSRGTEIQKLAKVLRIEKNVRFVGHLSEHSFAQMLEGAGALLFPSLHEGFGIPLLEAMRFRKAIICSKSASVPEVAGDAAICVEAKNPAELAAAMIKLTRDSGLREDLVIKGQERLKKFRLGDEIDKLYEVLRTAKLSNCRSAKFGRWLRCYRNFGRLSLRKAKAIIKVISTGAVLTECLRQLHVPLYATKAKLSRLKVKFTSSGSLRS